MKYLKPLQLLEGVESYNYELTKVTEDFTIYKFSDGNWQFRVEFDTDKEDGEAELRWFVWDGQQWGFKEVPTNIFRITNTILGDILREFISENDWCNSIVIVGLPKEIEKSEISQRTKVYLRYLRNNPIKGWTLGSYINEIYLDKN